MHLHGWSVLALQLLAIAPGALTAPLIPTGRAVEPRSFRAQVKHRLHEERGSNLDTRATGKIDVAFNSYWFAEATAGGQAVTMLIDTGSADLYVSPIHSPHLCL